MGNIEKFKGNYYDNFFAVLFVDIGPPMICQVTLVIVKMQFLKIWVTLQLLILQLSFLLCLLLPFSLHQKFGILWKVSQNLFRFCLQIWKMFISYRIIDAIPSNFIFIIEFWSSLKALFRIYFQLDSLPFWMTELGSESPFLMDKRSSHSRKVFYGLCVFFWS